MIEKVESLGNKVVSEEIQSLVNLKTTLCKIFLHSWSVNKIKENRDKQSNRLDNQSVIKTDSYRTSLFSALKSLEINHGFGDQYKENEYKKFELFKYYHDIPWHCAVLKYSRQQQKILGNKTKSISKNLPGANWGRELLFLAEELRLLYTPISELDVAKGRNLAQDIHFKLQDDPNKEFPKSEEYRVSIKNLEDTINNYKKNNTFNTDLFEYLEKDLKILYEDKETNSCLNNTTTSALEQSIKMCLNNSKSGEVNSKEQIIESDKSEISEKETGVSKGFLRHFGKISIGHYSFDAGKEHNSDKFEEFHKVLGRYDALALGFDEYPSLFSYEVFKAPQKTTSEQDNKDSGSQVQNKNLSTYPFFIRNERVIPLFLNTVGMKATSPENDTKTINKRKKLLACFSINYGYSGFRVIFLKRLINGYVNKYGIGGMLEPSDIVLLSGGYNSLSIMIFEDSTNALPARVEKLFKLQEALYSDYHTSGIETIFSDEVISNLPNGTILTVNIKMRIFKCFKHSLKNLITILNSNLKRFGAHARVVAGINDISITYKVTKHISYPLFISSIEKIIGDKSISPGADRAHTMILKEELKKKVPHQNTWVIEGRYE